jgi:RNA polymerase sigma-70 factor (ECF subfamily)
MRRDAHQPPGGQPPGCGPAGRAAFLAALRHHDQRLRGLAYRLLGGDRARMDDALQEAYLRAYRSLGTFRADADIGTWLYRITYNSCIDELRRGQRRPDPVDTADTAWERPSGTASPADRAADRDLVRRALARLPDDQRVTVVLVDAEGMDHDQAASVLGVAPGTVASRLSRAHRTMRLMIGQDR